MLESVSPYALLCASIPQKESGIVTAYDLYSAAQSSANARIQPSAGLPIDSASQPPAAPEAPLHPPMSPPARRTHYIADIQSRHNRAACRACQR